MKIECLSNAIRQVKGTGTMIAVIQGFERLTPVRIKSLDPSKGRYYIPFLYKTNYLRFRSRHMTCAEKKIVVC